MHHTTLTVFRTLARGCKTRVAAAMCVLGACLSVSFGASATPAFEDTLAQRLQACTGCHGEQGRASPGGYMPRLAGKPAGYLFHQLLNFRDGRRGYGPMTSLVDPLSDDYLEEIAAHFASLDLTYPPPQPATASAATLERGERLVRQGDPAAQVPACSRCHGDAMMGVAPAIPGLLGLPRDYVNAQLGAWRTGKRRAQAPDCMAHVAKQLSLSDIHAVSQWLAMQPVPPGAKPLAAWPAGQRLPVACGGVGVDAVEASGASR
jgi:cytochrome c553